MVSNQPGFPFATGIENSIPTIDGGRVSLLGAGRYDWSFADAAFPDLRRRGLVPIVDLCHFGLPDFLGDFQNPDFPGIFAAYARAFAQRYPWIQLYTPVNEMSICALFSALYGWWNEQMRSDRAFVTALKHIVKANLLAMRAILEVRPDALFVQSESTEYFHAMLPAAIGPAETMNARRFLSLDLNYGRRVDSTMYEYLLDNGMRRDEYHFFLNNNLKHHCIMGNDYYQTNEHHVSADGSTVSSGEIFGYAVITHQYYNRRTCCGSVTTACPWSASPGTPSPTRSTGTAACARTMDM